VYRVQGVEATLFAALMSILNGGAFTGSFLGSLLTRALGVDGKDFTNLAPLVCMPATLTGVDRRGCPRFCCCDRALLRSLKLLKCSAFRRRE
jgi:BT1 family